MAADQTTSTESTSRTPVYFFSHGGPTFMYSDKSEEGGDLGAFNTLRKIGKSIVEEIKPKAIVVFSAHWQASPDTVEVNTAEFTDLIYDFYGFPSYMYKEKYANVGSASIGEKIIKLLSASGIKARGVKRGLDHGVWVPFKVAFSDAQPVKVPIIQVSLFATEDPNQHYNLGKALAPLRDENIVIIGSGMTVHNLREMGYYWGSKAPYAKKFDDILEKAVNGNTGENRRKALADIFNSPESNKSHPTKEHLLPIYIAAGAAQDDKSKRVYSNQTSSLAWGEYIFGGK
ncbi:Extradiol ring-cleavage dioxygenase, class III enzyme, subunit B [Lipomyces japonicus]|uniref:Extradiol ring-cleavage dioxygenase, class III enzyme, subunit B n=1 Tax=Lipomyces japonicus TaxID=56871 RepID=UPI0034CF8143